MAANEEARPFGQTEVVEMTLTISVSTGAPYGIERVCDMWEKEWPRPE